MKHTISGLIIVILIRAGAIFWSSQLAAQGPMPRPRSTNDAVPNRELAVKSRASVKSPILSESFRPDTLRPLAMVFGDSTHFDRITSIFESSQHIVITDSRTSPHVFVFDRKSAKLLKTMGPTGEGPGEIMHPDNVIEDEQNQNVIWVYDFNQRRFVGLDVRGRRTFRPLTLSLPLGGSLLQPMIRKGRVISNGLFPDYSLIFLNERGEPIGKGNLGLPFSAPEVESVVGRRLLNVSSMSFSPKSRSKIVLAYQFKSELDLLDLTTGRHIAVTGPRQTKASFRIANNRFFWNDDNQHAYRSVTADENRVYALFSGHKDDDKRAYTSRVHVFDWNGRFLREHAFDRLVGTITVSSSGTQLYASVEDPWPSVVVYQLPPP